jgi:hypothetical protein
MKINTKTVLVDANKMIDTWNANPEFTAGTLTQQDLVKLRDALLDAEAAVQARRTGLRGLIGLRDDAARALSKSLQDAKNWIRVSYGIDSAQYKQIGGIRLSERKYRRSASAATSTPAPATDQSGAKIAA